MDFSLVLSLQLSLEFSLGVTGALTGALAGALTGAFAGESRKLSHFISTFIKLIRFEKKHQIGRTRGAQKRASPRRLKLAVVPYPMRVTSSSL